ncbi:3329_t:CDS:1, partial [Entrophospora sp. SA101]
MQIFPSTKRSTSRGDVVNYPINGSGNGYNNHNNHNNHSNNTSNRQSAYILNPTYLDHMHRRTSSE